MGHVQRRKPPQLLLEMQGHVRRTGHTPLQLRASRSRVGAQQPTRTGASNTDQSVSKRARPRRSVSRAIPAPALVAGFGRLGHENDSSMIPTPLDRGASQHVQHHAGPKRSAPTPNAAGLASATVRPDGTWLAGTALRALARQL